MKDMTKCELLKKISEYQFVTVELNLYLDTHPCDADARNDYLYYSTKLCELIEIVIAGICVAGMCVKVEVKLYGYELVFADLFEQLTFGHVLHMFLLHITSSGNRVPLQRASQGQKPLV